MTYFMNLAFVGILVIYVALHGILKATQDVREPPTTDNILPFIGPCLDMIRRGSRYFNILSHIPIYTLRLPGLRLYVVNSSSLIPLVQRKCHGISFEPILLKVAAGIMAFSNDGMAAINRHAPDEHGLLEESAKNNRLILTTGPKLCELESVAIAHITKVLDELARAKTPQVVNLYEWITLTIIQASTETIYGPQNPFKDPENVKAWQDFGSGFVPLLVNFFPKLLARKPFQAREHLVKSFELYFEQEGHKNPRTSALIQNRFEIFRQRGISKTDMARHEAGSSLALLINTIPATFWVAFHILSDPMVLSACRRELVQGVTVNSDGTHTIDLAFIKTSCPTLLSTFKETLRFHGINVAARVITEDTLVNDQYKLKQGGILLIPSTVQHNLPSVWGDDADEFNHQRFLRDLTDTKGRGRNPTTLRVFGGGSVICPGRYFATTEILALSALMVLRFDVRPRSGRWAIPTVHKSNPGISFQQPDEDIAVEVQPRDNWAWNITMPLSKDAGHSLAQDDLHTSE